MRLMKPDHEIWRAAYNAALTGYLSLGINDELEEVSRYCASQADAALKAFKAKWPM